VREFGVNPHHIWGKPPPHFPYGIMLIDILIADVQRNILASNANHILAGE